MADPLADASDLAGFWRELTSTEVEVAGNLLVVASAIVRRRFPDIDARILAGSLDLVIVRYVLSEMIKSAVAGVSRPVDAKSESESVGPFAHSVTYDTAVALGRLGLAEDLAALLAADGVGLTAGIGAIRLGRANVPSGVWPNVCLPLYPRQTWRHE